MVQRQLSTLGIFCKYEHVAQAKGGTGAIPPLKQTNMLLNATFKRFSPHYLRLLHSRILVDGAMVVQCGVAFIESSFMNESDTGRRSRVLSLRDGSKKTRSLPRIVV